MSYTVLARRYRPESFDSLVGQEKVVQTLQNAIGMSRIGHAYLFCGPRGVGKTSAARIFAKALNCEKGTSSDPCLECETCKNIARGTASDVIEIDGASNNSVDDIREIRENAGYAPIQAPFKIYIIDEVHMVTRAGFNALLKILEEPPAHVIFIFATTEAHKIPETILSRCQRFDFRSIDEGDIAKRLIQILDEEKMEMDPEALQALARYAEGGMRNAQSSLDQLITFSGGQKIEARHLADLLGLLTESELLEILEISGQSNLKDLLTRLDHFRERNLQPEVILDQLLELIRDLIRLKNGALPMKSGRIPEHLRAQAGQYAEGQSDQGFMAAIDLLQNGKNMLARRMDPWQALEMTLLNLGHLGQLPTLSQLMAEMVSSKKKSSSSS